MARVAGVLLGIGIAIAVSSVILAQTEVLILDTFDTGILDLAVWGDGTGAVPTVTFDGVEHGFVLDFVSSGGSQQILGTTYSLPAFESDDVLLLSIDVRRNTDSSCFVIATAYDQPPGGGTYGATSAISAMWGLPFPDYHAGLSGDPWFPTASGDQQGFRVQVPSEPTASPPDGDKDDYLVPYLLSADEWYTLQLEYTPEMFSFLANQQALFGLDSSQLYYDFSQVDDWLFLMGDGGTHSWQPANLSVDNVALIRTKSAILAIANAFPQEDLRDPLSLARLNDWYQTYGPELLMEALAACGGDYEGFTRYLSTGRCDELAARIVLVSVEQVGRHVTMTIRNIGNAEATGNGTLITGLSYTTSWVAEWCTRFFQVELGEVSVAPREERAIVFELPDVPEAIFAVLEERLDTMWTGFDDTDPADYVCLDLVFPTNRDHVFGFLPLP